MTVHHPNLDDPARRVVAPGFYFPQFPTVENVSRFIGLHIEIANPLKNADLLGFLNGFGGFNSHRLHHRAFDAESTVEGRRSKVQSLKTEDPGSDVHCPNR